MKSINILSSPLPKPGCDDTSQIRTKSHWRTGIALHLLYRLAPLLLFLGIGMDPVQAQCTLDITRVTPSGCYYSGGQSLTTVTVEVAWANPPSGGITVQLGALTRTITPSSFKVISPQTVAFEIPANGAAGTVSADFDNNSACSDSENFTAPAACAPSPCPGGAGIVGGNAFNDSTRMA